jgi:hypothetical protein
MPISAACTCGICSSCRRRWRPLTRTTSSASRRRSSRRRTPDQHRGATNRQRTRGRARAHNSACTTDSEDAQCRAYGGARDADVGRRRREWDYTRGRHTRAPSMLSVVRSYARIRVRVFVRSMPRTAMIVRMREEVAVQSRLALPTVGDRVEGEGRPRMRTRACSTLVRAWRRSHTIRRCALDRTHDDGWAHRSQWRSERADEGPTRGDDAGSARPVCDDRRCGTSFCLLVHARDPSLMRAPRTLDGTIVAGQCDEPTIAERDTTTTDTRFAHRHRHTRKSQRNSDVTMHMISR